MNPEGKWKGMVDGQPSQVAASRTKAAGYLSPHSRIKGSFCYECKHSAPRAPRSFQCELHNIRVHKLGICPSFVRPGTRGAAAQLDR